VGRVKEANPLAKQVFVLTKYSDGGASSRHRTRSVLSGIRGADVRFSHLFDDRYLKRLYSTGTRSIGSVVALYFRRCAQMAREVRGADVTVVEKELFPWIPWFVERVFWRMCSKVVVDIDDAIYANYENVGLLKKKIAHVMGRADCVVAGNEVLAQYARQWASKVIVIPTTVDTREYIDAGGNGEKSPLRVGWVGTPATQVYLEDLLPVLDGVAESGDFEVVVVGARESDAFRDRAYIQVVEWTPDAERNLGALFDLGIMPLRDGVFERGKCGFKILQYNACGLPSVASPVGANKEIVRNGITGLLASTPTEWSTALLRCKGDRGELQKMGKAAREYVVENYDRTKAIEQWADVVFDRDAHG
jgi:glycosyltransferase involved in cell wall biosynthesis